MNLTFKLSSSELSQVEKSKLASTPLDEAGDSEKHFRKLLCRIRLAYGAGPGRTMGGLGSDRTMMLSIRLSTVVVFFDSQQSPRGIIP